MKTLLQNGLVIALVLSSAAPIPAQGIRQSASRMGSSIAGGVRYSAHWINQQIESAALPRRARQ